MKKQTYHFEMTDTYGGECNYSWLHRFTIEAKNLRGALIKLSRETGLKFRNNGIHYKAKNACIAAYELDYEIDQTWSERSVKL